MHREELCLDWEILHGDCDILKEATGQISKKQFRQSTVYPKAHRQGLAWLLEGSTSLSVGRSQGRQGDEHAEAGRGLDITFQAAR